MPNIPDCILDSLSIDTGEINTNCNIFLFTVIKNEEFFIPSFLDHYRKIGVEQFLFLDDKSSDKTRDMLKNESDCVILSSPYSFGDEISFTNNKGQQEKQRVGKLLKAAIPEKFLRNKLGIYADADEFLVFPSGINNLQELYKIMREKGIKTIAASQIEFYPKNLTDLSETKGFSCLKEILHSYPYFDAETLVTLHEGKQPGEVGDSASKRLFARYHIAKPLRYIRKIPPKVFQKIFRFPVDDSSVFKTPVFLFEDGVELIGSHNANVAPTDKILLGLFHFKYTCDSKRRIDQALELKSHRNKSLKYKSYYRLFKEMAGKEDSFIGPKSKEFRNLKDLEHAGLIKNDFFEKDVS